MIASRLLWLAVLVPSVQEDGNLTVGDSLQGELSVDAPLLDGHGAAVRHELAVVADGWVTITLHSLDFDALLRLERADGELLAEDDNGGTETDARLCLRLEAGTTYRLTAAAARPAEGGEYQLTAATGQPEELSGAEQLDAAIEFRTRAAERARERDQLASAAGHLLELGTHQLLRARISEASATWEQVRSLATELGDEELDARAMARLSESLVAAGQTARARELAQAALAFHVDTGDVREEGVAVRALATVHHLLGEQARAIELFERLEEIAGELDDQHMLGQALYGLATSMQFLGRSDEAADRLQEAREIFHEVGDPSGEARVLNSVAMASSARRDYLQARDQFEAAVELFQESGDQASEAMALANLGHTYQKMGAFAEALTCADEALGMAEATGYAHGVQWALCALGETYQSQGDFPRALEHHRARLEMVEREGNDWACSWANLGVAKALSSMGRLDEAVLHLDAAHGVASMRGDESLLGDLASARGAVLFFRWDFPAARAEYETQLSTAERLGDRKNQASALGGIAICEANLQEYERAGELLEQALWIYDELGDDSGMLWVRSNQADVFRHQGALTLAEQAYEEVLDLAERLDQPMQVPRAHFGLGSVRHDLGDFFRAQESFDRARTLALARADANTALQARLMLVDLRVHFCDYQAAIEGASTCLEQARAMGSTGDEHHALGLLAVSQLEQGDLGGAQMLYEQSLALEGGSARGPVLTNLGLIHLSLGEFEEARRRFQERLDLARRSGTPTGEAWALNGLARVAHEQGKAGEGRELALEAYRISRRMGALDVRENILLTLVEQELAAGDAGSVRRRLQEVERLLNRPTHHAAEVADSSRLRHRKFMWAWIAQDLTHLDLESAGERAVAQRRAIEEGFVRLGQWKSRGLLEGIVEHREGARSQEALRLRQERRTAELRRDSLFERMGARVAGGGSQAEIDDLRGQAEAAWARADELGEELARVSPRDAAVDLPRGVGPEAIRRRLLDAETVLIEYAQGLEQLYAYVISPGRLRHVDLGPRAEIEALAQKFLAAVSSPTEVSLGVLAELGRELHETLLVPVLATLDESPSRLLIVPSSELAGVPFEAFVLPAGSLPAGVSDPSGLVYVLDRYEVSYGPSSPVLVELAQMEPRADRGRVLVMADPLYPGEVVRTAAADVKPPSDIFAGFARRSAPTPRNLRRLTKTRDEALALARLLLSFGEGQEAASDLLQLEHERSGSLTTGLFDLHLGADARPSRLAGDLRQFSVLHFAAHGYVDNEIPQNTGIALAFTEGRSGFFTVADALELDLDAQLVVLSACETARGELRSGIGVQTLARAFMYSGARSVVASLWQVEDTAAAETMTSFYTNFLRGGMPPERALREAKLELRRGRGTRGVGLGQGGRAASAPSSHPFFWAPFIYLGLPH